MRENSWLSYTEEDDKNVEVLAQEYKEFLSKCKTERECTQYFIKEAESHGYQDLNKLIAQGTRLKAGDKVYGVGMGKTIALFQIGKQPLTEGMNILCAHIDSPRLDLKQNPLYEDTEYLLWIRIIMVELRSISGLHFRLHFMVLWQRRMER